MKSDTILVLGGLAIGGYILLNSDIIKNISGVGGGVSEAVGGLGGGISDVAGDISQVTGNVASLTDPLGAYGQQFAGLINAYGENVTSSFLRETQQRENIDISSFEAAQPQLAEQQSLREIYDATSQTKRNVILEDFKTQSLGNVTDFVSSGTGLLSFNPFSLLTKFIRTSAGAIKEATSNIPITSNNVSSGGAVSKLSSSASSRPKTTSGGTTPLSTSSLRKSVPSGSNVLTRAVASTQMSIAKPKPSVVKRFIRRIKFW